MATKEKKVIVDQEDKNVRVNPETLAEVKKYCAENGMKIGWFYNQAAKQYLELRGGKVQT